jgi:hypothetical protein
MVSPIPVGQQHPERDRRFDGSLKRRASLGDPKVQRVVAPLGEQPVCADHHDRVVVLDRNLDVQEAVLLEQRALPEGAVHEGLCGCLAVRGQQARVKGAGIDADADGDLRSRRRLRDLRDLVVELLMLPGFTRTAAHPASMAAKTYLGWK